MPVGVVTVPVGVVTVPVGVVRGEVSVPGVVAWLPVFSTGLPWLSVPVVVKFPLVVPMTVFTSLPVGELVFEFVVVEFCPLGLVVIAMAA